MLNLDYPHMYAFSSFRQFLPKEKHIDRVCEHDVLLMVYDGILRFHEDGKPIEVSTGEYYIQKRGFLQEGRIPSDEPMYYYVHFIGNYESSAHRLPMRGKADFAQFMPLFKQLDLLQASHAAVIEKHTIFYQILSLLNLPFVSTEGKRIVQKMIAQVIQDLQSPYSLEDLAHMSGYSKNYVIRLFRQETGQTPHAYINSMRIEMARRLLLNSEMSIEQIALSCGFGTYSNFYREFGRIEACSPMQYRQRHK